MKTKSHVIGTLRKTREKLWEKTLTSPCRFKIKMKTGSVSKHSAREALNHFEKLREMAARRPSPFKGMTEKKIIEKLRQTRKKLWEKKIGTGA